MRPFSRFLRPSTDTGPPFLYGDSDTVPDLVAFYDTLGYGGHIFHLNPRAHQQWHSPSSWKMKRDFYLDIYTILNRI